MTQPLVIPHAAFQAAFVFGDVSTISAYLSQPSVRLEIVETEALIAADTSTSLIINSPNGVELYPWYYDQQRRVLLLQVAVINGYFDVIQWFFSQPRLALMRQALTRVFSTVAHIATCHNQHEILEWLLSDHVSGVLQTEPERHPLLNDLLLAMPRDDATIQLVLAHGADINDSRVLPTWTVMRSNNNGRAFLVAQQQGAFLVGADLLIFATNTHDPPKIRQFLQLGLDFGSYKWNTHPLQQATTARDVETVRILVEEGFADVDCRDDEGQTPLIVACSATLLAYLENDDVPRQMAQIYLEAGANTAITDARGRSPLRWAIANEKLLPVLKLLLDCGADPNEYNAVGGPLLLDLNLDETDFEVVEPTLTLLLEAGADPMVCSEDGRSVRDQIRSTAKGREYIEAHPEFFGLNTLE